MGDKTLLVRNWKGMMYPNKSAGNAEICRVKYGKGSYCMEGVMGYDYFKVVKPISITILKINGGQVMVDDPLHFYGMKRLAECSSGNVCVAGLGLGIIVSHLVRNDKVKNIDVYEINKDVIDLVMPLLPRDKRINILHEDFFMERYRKENYDTIVIDLWVGEEGDFTVCGTEDKIPIFNVFYRVKANSFCDNVFVWGVRDSDMNPAVQ